MSSGGLARELRENSGYLRDSGWDSTATLVELAADELDRLEQRNLRIGKAHRHTISSGTIGCIAVAKSVSSRADFVDAGGYAGRQLRGFSDGRRVKTFGARRLGPAAVCDLHRKTWRAAAQPNFSIVCGGCRVPLWHVNLLLLCEARLPFNLRKINGVLWRMRNF